MDYNENCFPSKTQLLLLRAGLAEPELGRAAWHEYCQRNNISNIDHASSSLLPLVFHNLRSDALYPAEFMICEGMYRHAWSKNNLELFRFKKMASLLLESKIDICLLKGAALILNDYRNAGLRVMGDIDVLVNTHQAHDAINLLEKSGWKSTFKISEDHVKHRHAILFYSTENSAIDLHWKVFSGSGFVKAFSDFTFRTQLLRDNFFDLKISALCAEDQLLHVIVHGLHYSPVPLIRWIPDAHFTLKNNSDFDWPYFFSQAEKIDVFIFVKKALLFLAEHKFADIPSTVIDLINKNVSKKHEIAYFKFTTRMPTFYYLHIINVVWHYHFRNTKSKNIFIALLTFPNAAKHFFRVDGYFKLIAYICREIYCRHKRLAHSH
ncbi:MAG: nucleotidyltransferase family protein [Gammaproteobacteria bacterium]|nr:nucleotidyltransferase family protein [Gammaproteobacteria bacterium]